MTVTVGEAARRLGVTPDAVRGRLQRGTLAGHKGPGGGWRVDVEGLPEDVPLSPGHRQDADLEAAYAAHLEDLRATIAEQRRTIATLSALVDRMAVKALPAPEDDRPSWWARLRR